MTEPSDPNIGSAPVGVTPLVQQVDPAAAWPDDSPHLPPGSTLIAYPDRYAVQVWYADLGQDHWSRWMAANGLPFAVKGSHEHLVMAEGIRIYRAPDGSRWLQVDYLVTGLIPGREERGPTVQLNREAGRCGPEDDGANDPAIDRWVVPLSADIDQQLWKWVPMDGDAYPGRGRPLEE